MAEVILSAGGADDVLASRRRALRKAGYQIITAATEIEILRLARDEKPNLIVLGKIPGISPEICLRLKTGAGTADIPVLAICSASAGKRWARHADLQLPEAMPPAALISIIRILLRAKAVERALPRVRTAAAGDSTTDVDQSNLRLMERLDELARESERLGRHNQYLREFVPEVAHELRSSLCSVIVVSSWILGEYSDQMDASGREYLLLLKESVDRMRIIVETAWQKANAVNQS
jgi:signal transduction histidine kinase